MGMGAGVLERLVKENLRHVWTFTDGEKKKGLDRGRKQGRRQCSLVFVCDVTFDSSARSSSAFPLFPPSLSGSLGGSHAQQRSSNDGESLALLVSFSFPVTLSSKRFLSLVLRLSAAP